MAMNFVDSAKMIPQRMIVLIFLVCLNVACDSSTGRQPEEKCTDRKSYWGNQETSIRMAGKICDGLREGYWASYRPDGTLAASTTFKKGLPFGPAKVFGLEGEQLYLVTFGAAGILDGVFESGSGPKSPFPSIRGRFSSDKPDGRWEWLDRETGQVWGYRVYSNDGLVVDSIGLSKIGEKDGYDPLIIVDFPIKALLSNFSEFP
jgi:hypothetical protein